MQALAQTEAMPLTMNLLEVILRLCDSEVKVEDKVTPAHCSSQISRSSCLLCLLSLTPVPNTQGSIFSRCTNTFYCKVNTKFVDSTGKTKMTSSQFLRVLKEVVAECFGSLWGAWVIYLNGQKLRFPSGATYLLPVSFPLMYAADVQVQVATGSGNRPNKIPGVC